MAKVLYDTRLPADTVEVVPFVDKDSPARLISIGTYNYDEMTRTRTGHLEIIRYNADQQSLTPIQCIKGTGVLDVNWSCNGSGNVNAVLANSDGTISIGDLSDDGQLCLQPPIVIEKDAITMSCDTNSTADVYATAMSSGRIYVCSKEEDSSSFAVTEIGSHDLEAWTVTFGKDPNILYSGGDDGKWITWDIRNKQAITTNKYHSAGVCSIRPHPTNQHLILTGSYDKQCALWDDRSTSKVPLKNISVSSGVWKLKWNPSNDMRVLAACMYDGFHIFDFEATSPQIVKSFNPDALSYGCAWLNEEIALTCSFYNSQVQIW